MCLPSHYSAVTSPILCSKLTFLTNMSSPPVIGQAMGKGQLPLVDQTFLRDIIHLLLVIINLNFCEYKMSIWNNTEVTCSFRSEVWSIICQTKSGIFYTQTSKWPGFLQQMQKMSQLERNTWNLRSSKGSLPTSMWTGLNRQMPAPNTVTYKFSEYFLIHILRGDLSGF